MQIPNGVEDPSCEPSRVLASRYYVPIAGEPVDDASNDDGDRDHRKSHCLHTRIARHQPYPSYRPRNFVKDTGKLVSEMVPRTGIAAEGPAGRSVSGNGCKHVLVSIDVVTDYEELNRRDAVGSN